MRAGAEVPQFGGLHTLRHIEDRILDHVEVQRRELAAHTEERARFAQEAGFRRARDASAAEFAHLSARVDRELPPLWERLEEDNAEWREDAANQRAQTAARFEVLAGKIQPCIDELPEVGKRLNEHAKALRDLEDKPPELFIAIDTLREDLRKQGEEFKELLVFTDMERYCSKGEVVFGEGAMFRLGETVVSKSGKDRQVDRLEAKAKMTDHAADIVGQRWGKRLEERIATDEKILRDVDDRSRSMSKTAVDTAALVEERLVASVAQARFELSEEARNFAADAAAKLREEMYEDLAESLKQRMDAGQQYMDTKIGIVDAKLRDELRLLAAEVPSVAERAADSKVNAHAEGMADVVESIRKELDSQTKRHGEAADRWSDQLAEVRTMLRDADSRASMEAAKVQKQIDSGAAETAQLRAESSDAQRALSEQIAALRSTVQEQGSVLQGKHDKVDAEALAKQVLKRMDDIEASHSHQSSWLEKKVHELAVRCQSAEADAGDAKSRVHRETADLDGELKTVRAATTSLTHGVIKSLQVLGLLHPREPDPQMLQLQKGRDLLSRAHLGLDLGDLLVWEKAGHPLAARVAQQWHDFEVAGVPNVLALVERKAAAHEVRSVKAAVSGRGPGSGLAALEKPPTPSTAATETGRSLGPVSPADSWNPSTAGALPILQSPRVKRWPLVSS